MRIALIARKRDEQDGYSKSSDEYEVLERVLIHPMTTVSKMDSTLKYMI
jgi:hypothetical protein